ncbi:WD40 repeat domain-containing protein [Bradyrhizobium sp. CER78]|uniref:WD40 repeat domain-containing protein n=1 Tax=Bradyrhizobium sp. CER78 TaxID=3039162 RepID=UPI0024481DB9|nr:WD40 repeat domain-containing protein [Bradyrhizobium sp. CER78]MDH2380829.1 WD40 repeat domain-containing protein [Bradyrhizobium sp. CER78]
MNTMEAQTATLYELLGRHWTVGAPVADIALDAAGEAVAFALADGGITIAPLIDTEPPQDRCRTALDEGRSTIMPRRKPVLPLSRVVVGDVQPHLAPLGTSGFVASDGGRLLRVSASGVTELFASQGSSIDLVASVPAGGILSASGGSIVFYDSNGDVGWLQQRSGGNASAMAVSPDSRRFAIAADGRLLVRAFGARPDPAQSFELGPIANLAWSPDGGWLAVSIAKKEIALVRLADAWVVRIFSYPASVASLSWSADSRLLVTSGAYRMVVWDVSSLGDDREKPASVSTGRAGFVLVEAAELHPERTLVAAGYADGRVVVAKVGTSDELLVKPAGGGAVQSLRWSKDGQHLAFGTAEGEAAIVTFPAHIFK